MLNQSWLLHPASDRLFELIGDRYNLTSRERKVVQILALSGCNNRMMAEMLYVSEKTIKNHLANIHLKTGTNSTREMLSLIFQVALYGERYFLYEETFA